MKRIVGLLAGVWLITGVALMAQQPEPGQQPPPPGGGQFQSGGPPQGPPPHGQMGQPPQRDLMSENFFAPELLMQNQKKIGLTDEQQKYIREQIREVQGKVTDLQWQIQGEQETLQTLAKQEKADEKAFVASLDKMLSLENEIKRSHLTLLVRIKNKLTPEQQDQLREMRQPRRLRGAMPGGPGGPPTPGR